MIRELNDSIPGIDQASVIALLQQYVENSKFENNFPNKGYCDALGFELKPW